MCRKLQGHYHQAHTHEVTTDRTHTMECWSMQRIGEYKESDQASALKQRDYKDATDLVMGGGI